MATILDGKALSAQCKEEIRKEAEALAEMLYLTEIDGFFQGDVFFPPLPAGQFARIAEERHDGEIPYVYVTYRRYK